jgi:hypothetical protein
MGHSVVVKTFALVIGCDAAGWVSARPLVGPRVDLAQVFLAVAYDDLYPRSPLTSSLHSVLTMQLNGPI